ncbi:MAG: hypothetical protein M0T70_02930 [Geobacteraceae bacterium]|nr:hypothetical protein [Geobacteraceae bacterium]
MYRILIIALTLAVAIPCQAGYSIYTREQVTPASITVHGVDGPVTRNNPGTVPIYPATFQSRICAAKDLYSPSAADRTEVWGDSAGTATDTEVFAACTGLKVRITDEITDIRRQALDRATRSHGVFAVYDENYRAAYAVTHNNGSLEMKNQITAEQYCAGMGSELTPPLTAVQFADYILSENYRVGDPGFMDERQYLWFTCTVIPAEQSVDELLDLPNQYRRYCGL